MTEGDDFLSKVRKSDLTAPFVFLKEMKGF